MDTTWTQHLPPMAGYYWYLRNDSLGMMTLIKYYYVPDVGWMIQDMDTGEGGRREAFMGQFSERLLPPYRNPERGSPLASPSKEAQQPVSEAPAPPVSTEPRGEPSGSPAPPSPAPATELIVLDGHELRLEDTGDADAACTCGGWRLLRIEPGQGRSAGRNSDILQAFQLHLKTVVEITLHGPNA